MDTRQAEGRMDFFVDVIQQWCSQCSLRSDMTGVGSQVLQLAVRFEPGAQP